MTRGRPRAQDLALLGGAAGLALLWPLSAYLASPLLVPGAALMAGLGLVLARRPAYAVAGLIALVPLTNMHVGGGRPLRIVLPALALALLAYLLLRSRVEEKREPDALVMAVLGFTAVAIASALVAIDPAEALTKVFSLLTAVALFFAALQLEGTRPALNVLVGGVVGALLVASIQGVLQHAQGQFAEAAFLDGANLVNRIQGSFGHPNQYGGFVAVLMPIAGSVVLSRGFPRFLRALATVAFAFALPALTFSYARGAIVAAALGTVLWLAAMRPKLALAAVALTVTLGVLFAPSTLKDRVTAANDTDVGIRSDLWGGAVDIYDGHPIFGVGLNNFGVAYARLPSSPPHATQRRLLHQTQILTPPHAANLYLNVLAEQGLVGILALAGFVAALLSLAWRASGLRDRAGRAAGVGLGAAVLTLAVHSVLEVTLFGEILWPLLALAAAAAGYVRLADRRSVVSRK